MATVRKALGMKNPEDTSFRIMEQPKPAGMVIMQPEPFKTTFPISVYPNWWRRFWYWNLLGWRFERNEEARRTGES